MKQEAFGRKTGDRLHPWEFVVRQQGKTCSGEGLKRPYATHHRSATRSLVSLQTLPHLPSNFDSRLTSASQLSSSTPTPIIPSTTGRVLGGRPITSCALLPLSPFLPGLQPRDSQRETTTAEVPHSNDSMSLWEIPLIPRLTHLRVRTGAKNGRKPSAGNAGTSSR